MELTWYGTAALALREGDVEIAFDPFLGFPLHCFERPGIPLKGQKELKKISHVFITHGHVDHIYHIPRLYKNRPVTVYGTRAPRVTLKKLGFSDQHFREIGPGFSGTVGPLQIQAWQGRHCRFDLPLIIKTVCCRRFWRYPRHVYGLVKRLFACPEKGEILFYEVTNGTFRLQIMGSMNLDRDTQYPTGADLLILPFQGRSDQDQYALQFIERLKPKAVMLDHYDNSYPPITGHIEVNRFVSTVKKKYHISCEPMTKYRRITLS